MEKYSTGEILLAIALIFMFFIVLAIPWIKQYPRYKEEMDRGVASLAGITVKMILWQIVYFVIYAMIADLLSVGLGYDIRELIGKFFGS